MTNEIMRIIDAKNYSFKAPVLLNSAWTVLSLKQRMWLILNFIYLHSFASVEEIRTLGKIFPSLKWACMQYADLISS